MPQQTATATDLPEQRQAELAGDAGLFTREAQIIPGSYNADDNTVDVCFSTGARGLRYDWATDTVYEEELDITPEAVDMARIDAGVCQVLDSHRAYGGLSAIMGIAKRGWVEAGKAMATLQLSGRDDMRGYVADIKAGIIRAISVGYRVDKWLRVMPEARTDGGSRILMRALRWQPHELSFVTVPFDMGASTRALDGAAPAATQDTQATRALDTATALRLSAGSAQAVPDQVRAAAPNSAAVSAALQRQVVTASVTPAAPAANTTQLEQRMPDPVNTAGAPQDAAINAAAQAAAQEAAQRAADITALCVRHGVADQAAQHITSGATVDAVARSILEARAATDAAAGTQLNVRAVQTVQDETETRLRGMEEAIANRVDVRSALTDNGRRFRGFTMLEMGRAMLERAGVRTEGWDRMRLAAEVLNFRSGGGLMGTSDFAYLLANVASKRLRMGYEENPGTYSMWARRAPNAPDFKTMSVVQLAAMPDLLQTNEAGEFKYGALTDGQETYALATYGRIVPFSRQALINDDLRGFDRVITGFGAAAARLENRTVYSQITLNAAMADGVALFHATHANLGTGGGSALSLDAMSAGRKAMRLQKGLQSEELNLAPSFLIVPAALETTAYQLTSNNYTPATTAAINEFRPGGRTAVTPVVEPILDAVSATAWYFAASNSQVDTVEYCWLDGAEGPVIESKTGFEVDGIEFKCREDFAAKVIDYRGLYKSAGA